MTASQPCVRAKKRDKFQFVSDITDGALSPCVGTISGLCREFPLKNKKEQDALFKALLDAPIMHVDGTAVRVDGSNKYIHGTIEIID